MTWLARRLAQCAVRCRAAHWEYRCELAGLHGAYSCPHAPQCEPYQRGLADRALLLRLDALGLPVPEIPGEGDDQ